MTNVRISGSMSDVNNFLAEIKANCSGVLMDDVKYYPNEDGTCRGYFNCTLEDNMTGSVPMIPNKSELIKLSEERFFVSLRLRGSKQEIADILKALSGVVQLYVRRGRSVDARRRKSSVSDVYVGCCNLGVTWEELAERGMSRFIVGM